MAEPTAPELPPQDRRLDALVAAGLVIIGVLVYLNALRGAFVFDDVRQIRDNPVVRELAAFAPGRYPGDRWARYVGYLSFALNYRLAGLWTPGFHAVNVLVHVANALLVYALVRLTFRTPRARASALAASAPVIGAVAAALFLVHPLQTQAVAYVVQRLTSLATTFYLAALVLYASWRLGATGAPRWRGPALAAGAVVSAVLAMGTKEISFTLPLAIALWEAAFLDGPWRPRLARLAPLLLSLPLVPLAVIVARRGGAVGLAGALAASTRVDSTLSRGEYLLTELVVVVKYLALLAWPTGQTVDHDVPTYRSLAEPRVAVSALLLVALAAVATFLWRRTARPGTPGALDPAARVVAFGVAWFFLTVSVESSFIPISDVMYEHRAYLPSVGIFLAFSCAVAALARRLPRLDPERVTAVAGGLLALVLAVATLARNEVWRDDLSLWSDAALKAPLKPRPFVNLGTALALSGRRELAARALKQAVALDPSSTYARAQLAAALLSLGRAVDAERELRVVLRSEPRDREALYNLAAVLWATDRREEARGLYARFLEVAPPAYAQARQLAVARSAPLAGAPPLR